MKTRGHCQHLEKKKQQKNNLNWDYTADTETGPAKAGQ